MNTIEEQLWDYIDGNLSETEAGVIEAEILNNVEFKAKYEELSKLNLAFQKLDLDEPSMSFTRNIMENIALLPAPVAMKTKVDTRIIYSIGGFFILSLLALFGYTVYDANLSWSSFNVAQKFTLEIDHLITPLTTNVFLFMDLILCLVLMDYVLRKKVTHK
ncbi:anti-sigma factor family protein [Pedobacter mucosus]|uniref:anti-sigma factor family protein n=1 Tax=Pedobacter mucosus TaxID=2895286 RepID=UPI001EE4AB8E|nr:hypothetical protein [Pedobacter mucosus]UKT63485.1 hypothetical protein LOK61_17160 [Pedobacter mucosus]